MTCDSLEIMENWSGIKKFNQENVSKNQEKQSGKMHLISKTLELSKVMHYLIICITRLLFCIAYRHVVK